MNQKTQLQAEHAFEDIVSDILYVFPESSRETAERSAVTFIRNPKMLVELSEMVKEKRNNEAPKNQ